jgi:hypothetical protein
MHKLDCSALSAGDRKVANRLHRTLLIVYSVALRLLGASAITSSKLFPPTATAGRDVQNEVPGNLEFPPVAGSGHREMTNVRE